MWSANNVFPPVPSRRSPLIFRFIPVHAPNLRPTPFRLHSAKDSTPQDIFEAIAWVKCLRLEHCLLGILHEKQLTIPQLHQRLEEKDKFLITRHSLYRYFNTNPESNRFPPRNFMQEFGAALDLPPEQIQLLDYLWQLCRLNQKTMSAQRLPIDRSVIT
ncbi:MAG: hypothetical protein VKL20_07305 [Synechocystis sp.]|nr:hypothetical protein [Synechocystis sp.]